MHKAMQQFAQMNISPYAFMAAPSGYIPYSLLQQPAAAAAAISGALAGTPGANLTLGMGGLLSPSSPTHPSSLSSNSGLASPVGLPTLSSLSNGMPTLSPNGLGSSADALLSPLHRYRDFLLCYYDSCLLTTVHNMVVYTYFFNALPSPFY